MDDENPEHTATPTPEREGWSRGRIVGAALGGGLVLMVAAFLVIGLFRDSGSSRIIDQAVRDGEAYQAPDFTLPVTNAAGPVTGPELTLSELRGHPIVLNIWASWCTSCPDEADNLDRIWTRYRDDGVVVLGINSQDEPDKAQAFIAKYGVTFPNVREGNDRVARDYGTANMPETFLIDPDGQIRFLPIRGPIDDAIEQQITAHLDRVIATGS